MPCIIQVLLFITHLLIIYSLIMFSSTHFFSPPWMVDANFIFILVFTSSYFCFILRMRHGLFILSHFIYNVLPLLYTFSSFMFIPHCTYFWAVSGEPTCRAPNADFLGNRPVGPPTPICWGADRSAPERQTADLSAPQQQFAGEPTGLLPNARQPTCRLPNDNLLGSRQVCSRTPESRPVGALTPIYAGEPTCLGSNGRRCSIGCSGSGYWHKSCPEAKVTIRRLCEYFVREQ